MIGDIRFDLWRYSVSESEEEAIWSPERGQSFDYVQFRKCKCLCSDVYTCVSAPEKQHRLPGRLLCHKNAPCASFARTGVVSECPKVGSSFVLFFSLSGQNLLSLHHLLLPGGAGLLNHGGLACKPGHLIPRRSEAARKLLCMRLPNRACRALANCALSVALFLSPSALVSPSHLTPPKASQSPFQPKNKLSGCSRKTGGWNAYLRLMLWGVALLKAVAMVTLSPGAAFLFFFYLMGGSRKPKERQLPEQWERGRWYAFPMVGGLWKMKRKKSDSSSAQ